MGFVFPVAKLLVVTTLVTPFLHYIISRYVAICSADAGGFLRSVATIAVWTRSIFPISRVPLVVIRFHNLFVLP